MHIFVFGSNLKGIHGAGAALDALRYHGAIRGIGEGLQGQSYAIPTKLTPWITLDLDQINHFVKRFITFAKNNPQFTFNVTRIGCGLAGYTDQQIAPMFKDAPSNCILYPGWDYLLRS